MSCDCACLLLQFAAEANAALKSDFLKEIATMKKITMGNCPYLVNMVGCCTLQEPLALVLEYVPHGDLLTYMRTMRKLILQRIKHFVRLLDDLSNPTSTFSAFRRVSLAA